MKNQPTTVTAALCCLPPMVAAGGRNFVLTIYCDYHPDDIRVCYALDDTYTKDATIHGSWRNPYAGGSNQSFLVVREGISTDAQLIEALLNVRTWLVDKGLLAADFDFRA